MKYSDFKKVYQGLDAEIFQFTLEQNRDRIKTRKPDTALKNLVKLFDAVFSISNQKGFQAMSMRDLSKAAGMSLGGLYDYCGSKDELLQMLQNSHRHVIKTVLENALPKDGTFWNRLEALVRTHLYLSEAMQPWFYFSYMEAKHLNAWERGKASASERYTEKLIADTLAKGMAGGEFAAKDPLLTAAVIKAMLQDWYLKRRKYTERGVDVDQYADFVLAFIASFCHNRFEKEMP